MQWQGLCLDTPGSHFMTRSQLAQVPTPPSTDTYVGVPFSEFAELVREKATERTGLPILDEAYGIARKGQHFFGAITMDTGESTQNMMLGLRGSHDKSMALAVATGSKVFVCSNMCISGDAVVVMRRHPKNVRATIDETIDEAIDRARGSYDDLLFQIHQMESIPMSEQDGYSLLGRMQGYTLLSPRQATVAYHDWRTPRHEEFSPRNAWSLYNCVTEGLKKTPVGGLMDRHTDAHAFMEADLQLRKRPLPVAVG